MTRHLQECVCSRLYVAVRDKLNLTYDVSFTLEQHDRLNASWWFVNVTASPDLVAKATQACVEVRALLFSALRSGRTLPRAVSRS